MIAEVESIGEIGRAPRPCAESRASNPFAAAIPSNPHITRNVV